VLCACARARALTNSHEGQRKGLQSKSAALSLPPLPPGPLDARQDAQGRAQARARACVLCLLSLHKRRVASLGQRQRRRRGLVRDLLDAHLASLVHSRPGCYCTRAAGYSKTPPPWQRCLRAREAPSLLFTERSKDALRLRRSAAGASSACCRRHRRERERERETRGCPLRGAAHGIGRRCRRAAPHVHARRSATARAPLQRAAASSAHRRRPRSFALTLTWPLGTGGWPPFETRHASLSRIFAAAACWARALAVSMQARPLRQISMRAGHVHSRQRQRQPRAHRQLRAAAPLASPLHPLLAAVCGVSCSIPRAHGSALPDSRVPEWQVCVSLAQRQPGRGRADPRSPPRRTRLTLQGSSTFESDLPAVGTARSRSAFCPLAVDGRETGACDCRRTWLGPSSPSSEMPPLLLVWPQARCRRGSWDRPSSCERAHVAQPRDAQVGRSVEEARAPCMREGDG
jgi:hypothetical protein